MNRLIWNIEIGDVRPRGLVDYIKKAVLILLFGITSIDGAYAQDTYRPIENIDFIQKKLSEIASTTTSIECAFVQKKTMSFMNQAVISTGQLYFEDNNLRWEYLEPYQYAILMVDEQLTIIDEGVVNETKLGNNPAFKKVQALLSHTLTGDFSDQEEFFDQQFQENDEYYRMILRPKEDQLKNYMREMKIYFSKDKFIVEKFVMDENGDETSTTFSNQKINQKLPADIFSW